MQLYSHWTAVPQADELAVQTISRELSVSSVTAALLVARGYGTPAAARAFLQPNLHQLHDAARLPDMESAVTRIGAALDRDEQIGIYGDYDVDGQTSTALLVRGLTALGATPRWYIPERVSEGYGLNSAAIEALAQDGVTLLITVDCGSGATAEVQRAAELGMDVIVTDHHEPGGDRLRAAAFVNPKRSDCDYPNRELAGVGVAFKLMHTLWRARGRDGYPPHAYELVALGTVADVCPLIDENRVLVHEGLARVNAGAMPALSALADVSGVERGQVSATRIAFSLAPRLNAAGRVGHAELGVRLLLSDDYDEALSLAQQLDEENRVRRELEADIVEEALAAVERDDLLSDWVLVVAGEGWHPGVIGIVASRLVERYARPAVVIGLDGDTGIGSARSIGAFDLFAALAECEDVLVRFGGHRMAAGLTVTRQSVAMLRHKLNEYAGTVLTPSDLVPQTRVDLSLQLGDVTEQLGRELEQLAPFGAGNPTPVLSATDAIVVGARTVGKEGDHLKLTLKCAETDTVHDAMAFGGGALLDAVVPGSQVHVAFGLRVGEWRGKPQLTLTLRALQSPLAVAEGRAALDTEPVDVDIERVTAVRGQPVRVVDRRARAAAHVLARVAYLAPLTDTGARIVAVVGEGEDGNALARSAAHTMHVDARVTDDVGQAAAAKFAVVSAMNRGTDDAGVPWSGHGHLVLFGLPARQHVLWSLLMQAAAAPGWTVHLAYDAAGTEASATALARRYPGEEALRVVYRTLRTFSGRTGAPLPSALTIASRIETDWSGLVDEKGVHHALQVFEQLGLLESTAAGLRLVPQGGRKVDVTTSARYNDGIQIQQNFAAYSRIALEANPAVLLALAAERSPLDGFAFIDPGSARLSEAGS